MRHAMDLPRFIELQRGHMASHSSYHVSPRSRIPPAVFHVKMEFRTEALKVYQQRNFDTIDVTAGPQAAKPPIYYKADTDILLFSESTCVSTMLSVFGEREDIPRVVVISGCTGQHCCCDTLRALNSLESAYICNFSKVGGCKGLKEVFIVVKSNLWPCEQGEIDAKVDFRPSTSNGLSGSQIRCKGSFMRYIGWAEPTSGVGILGNLWAGESKPTFHCVNFGPIGDGTDCRVNDGMATNSTGIAELQSKNRAFIQNVEIATGYEVAILLQEYHGEETREIGFHGPKRGVDIAKAAFQKRLASFGMFIADTLTLDENLWKEFVERLRWLGFAEGLFLLFEEKWGQ